MSASAIGGAPARRGPPARGSGRHGLSNGSNWMSSIGPSWPCPAIDGALDDVAQLADVAGPGIGLELLHRALAEAGPAVPCRCRAPSCGRKSRRGPGCRSARLRSGGKVTTSKLRRSSRSARKRLSSTRRGRCSLVAATMRTSTCSGRLDADPRHLAIFDRAQQPVLRRARQGGELVEEQGAAIGLLEPARPRLGRAGEGAGLVAEQFRLDQRLGQAPRNSSRSAARPSARRDGGGARRSAPCRCRARR